MDPFPEEYDYLEQLRPRRPWFGSVWFVVAAAVLAGGSLGGVVYVGDGRGDPSVWAIAIPLLFAPYVLVSVAARMAGRAGRGRSTVRVGGIMVVVGGVLLLLVIGVDVRNRMCLARPPDLPGIVFAWFPLVLLQSAGGTVAFVAAYPNGHATKSDEREDYADRDLPPAGRWHVWVLAVLYLAGVCFLGCFA
jgi:hypothetical protein